MTASPLVSFCASLPGPVLGLAFAGSMVRAWWPSPRRPSAFLAGPRPKGPVVACCGASNTHGKGGTWLALQGDGNLVLYTSSGQPVWATGTNGKLVSYLILRNNGRLALISPSGSVAWESPAGE